MASRRTFAVRPLALALAAAAALGLLVAGCGGGGGGGGEPEDDGALAAPPDLVGSPPGDVVTAPGPGSGATTATTEPPTSDLDGAFAVVEERVLEAADLVDSLVQHPAVVDDPDDPEVARLRRIYTDGSPVPDQLVALLRSLAGQGRHMRAAETGFFREIGIYDMTVIDDRSIGFYSCYVEDVQVVEATGAVADEYARVVQANGAAQRVDGMWRLVAMVPIEGFSRPLPPGVANPEVCDSAAAAAAEAPRERP